MVDTKSIESIKVVGMQKRKDPGSSKHYEFILRVRWNNKVEVTVYRPYSMFFDFQGVLCEMFKEKYSVTIPPVPATKFHWMLLGKLGIEKECRAIEEFCQKIINLPPLVAQSMVVLHFFEPWGTDVRAFNQQATDIIGAHGLGSPVIQSQESSGLSQETISASASSELQYRAIASFKATSSGEISFDEGSILTVAEKTDRGWWFVWDDRDQQGWAPATYLEPFGVGNEEESDEWMEMDDSSHLYSTLVSYAAQNPDEVSYGVGEEVEVLAKSNYGWWKIRYKDKVGLTPASNLKKKDEEYTSPAEVGRAMSISSTSGLYAVVRKAPPRKDSVRLSGNFSTKAPSRFVYSSTSFSGGKFSFDEDSNSAFQEKEMKSSNGQKNNQIMKRGQSHEAGQSYENVGVERSTSSPIGDEKNKGIKIQGVEFYSAIADYKPDQGIPGHLVLHQGDLMQLISVDEGWFFVELHRAGDVIEGWVPSTYVERKWDVDLDKMNISKEKSVTASPKPKPRPRPKPRDRPDEVTSLATPPIPTPRKGSKPFVDEAVSPTTSVAEKVHERPRLPPPTSNKGQQDPKSSSPLSMSPVPTAAQEQEAIMDSIYDEPEAQLRSVYDAEPWFFGKISRQQCEQMLKQNGRQQEFLVRESTRGSGSYALSVKYCYRIRHFPIETTTDGSLLIGKLTFANLIDVVNYYKENPLFYSEHKEPITLGNAFQSPS